MRAIVAARHEGVFDQAVEAMMVAMWEDGINLSDPAETASAFDRGGVDGKRLLERSGEDAIKAELAQNTASAVERGAFGIPTFFVGDEMWFGKERLAQVAAALG